MTPHTYIKTHEIILVLPCENSTTTANRLSRTIFGGPTALAERPAKPPACLYTTLHMRETRRKVENRSAAASDVCVIERIVFSKKTRERERDIQRHVCVGDHGVGYRDYANCRFEIAVDWDCIIDNYEGFDSVMRMIF